MLSDGACSTFAKKQNKTSRSSTSLSNEWDCTVLHVSIPKESSSGIQYETFKSYQFYDFFSLCFGEILKCHRQVEVIIKVKVKRSRYRPGVAQRVGRGIALLFHDRGTRRG